MENAEARAREFGIERVYKDPQQKFADGGFELIDIAAPVDAHYNLTCMAARHCVHVILQKPMVGRVAEAEAFIDVVGDKIRFMIHENYRFRPHYRTVRQWIDEGRIGDGHHQDVLRPYGGHLDVVGASLNQLATRFHRNARNRAIGIGNNN